MEIFLSQDRKSTMSWYQPVRCTDVTQWLVAVVTLTVAAVQGAMG